MYKVKANIPASGNKMKFVNKPEESVSAVEAMKDSSPETVPMKTVLIMDPKELVQKPFQ